MAKVDRGQGEPLAEGSTPPPIPDKVIQQSPIEEKEFADFVSKDGDIARQLALGNLGGGAGLYAFRQGQGFLFKTIQPGLGIEIDVEADSIRLHSRPSFSNIAEAPDFKNYPGKYLVVNSSGNSLGWSTPTNLFIQKEAGTAISGHRVVKVNSNGLMTYPDIDADYDGDFIIGISSGSCLQGEEAEAQIAGEIYEPTWNWIVGPVFCGDNGVLTQTPTVGKWLREVGIAVATDRIFIQLRPLIVTLGG